MIVAVDFDGTLCENAYPNIGSPNITLIEYLKNARSKNMDKLILWTCRCDDKLQEALDWCKLYGLEFDSVNEDLPEIKERFYSSGKKIFADVYIDDKALNVTQFNLLLTGEYNYA